jgi:hypothetical protein
MKTHIEQLNRREFLKTAMPATAAVAASAGLCSVAAPLIARAAEPDLLQAIKAAAQALADQKSYTWVSTGRSEGNGVSWDQSPTVGQIEKGGYGFFKLEIFGYAVKVAAKGEKRVQNIEGSWLSPEELTGDRAWIGRGLKAWVPPTAEAASLAGGATQLSKQPDGSLAGPLSEEAVKALVAGSRKTPTRGIKGSVKFWLKDGVLTKYEFNCRCLDFTGIDGNLYEYNRTTTVEIKDVGTTKVAVPEEAKKKL